MPGSRLEVFDGAGHFPHHSDPDRFLSVVRDFLASSEPATYSVQQWRALLRAGRPGIAQLPPAVEALPALAEVHKSACAVLAPAQDALTTISPCRKTAEILARHAGLEHMPSSVLQEDEHATTSHVPRSIPGSQCG
jgi:hypothetical protein